MTIRVSVLHGIIDISSSDEDPFDFEEQDNEESESDDDICEVLNFRDPRLEKITNAVEQQPGSTDATNAHGLNNNVSNFNDFGPLKYFIEIDDCLIETDSDPDVQSLIGQMFQQPDVVEYIPWKLTKIDLSQTIPQPSQKVQEKATIPPTSLDLKLLSSLSLEKSFELASTILLPKKEESVPPPVDPTPPKETHTDLNIKVLSSINLSSSEINAAICRPANHTKIEVIKKPMFPKAGFLESLRRTNIDAVIYGPASHIKTEVPTTVSCNKVVTKMQVSSTFPIAGTHDLVSYFDDKNWMTGVIEWNFSQVSYIQGMIGSMNPPNPREYSFEEETLEIKQSSSPPPPCVDLKKITMEQPIRSRDERLLCRHYAKGRYSRLLNKFYLKRD